MLLLEAAFITAVLLLSGTPVVESVLKFEGKAKLRGEPKIEANRDRPCSIECRVMSTTLLKYPPRVNWYKDKLFTLTNESLSEYVPVISPYWQSRQHYPRAKCVQQPGIVPRYNCDLNFEYCDAERWGRYRCNVTDIEDGQTISATLRLTSTALKDDAPPRPRCYMPRARNFSVVLHNRENGSLSAVLYWNTTQKPDRQQYCDGARQWTAGYKTFNSVWATPSDFETVTGLTRSNETATKRATKFEFRGISRSKYYIFQVHNEAMDDNVNARRPQDFASRVYYFGKQVPAQVTPQHRIINLTVGQTYTIRCTAVGTPTPTVRFLEDTSNIRFRYHDEEDDTITSEYVLHNVKRSDAGIYYCFAHNVQVNPPDGKRGVSDVKAITVTVKGPDTTHCISYTGSVCSPFIENIDFFVNDSQRDILDDWAMAAFTEIRQLEGSATTQGNQRHSNCVAFAKAVVCHSLYPYCDPSSDSSSPRPVCQNACDILTTGVCRGVFDALSSNVTELLTSNCDNIAREGGDNPECIHVSMEHPQKNEYDLVNTTGFCSRGNGWGYRGQVDTTEFGLPCQAWTSQTPHRHPRLPPHEVLGAGHACRNPWGLSHRPWCYTADPRRRWQYCNVPSCDVCERYSGSFCQSVTGFNTSLVYIDKTRAIQGQVEVERRMLSLFHWQQLGLSPGCSNALRQFICHSALPFCTSGVQGPKALCGEYCHLLDELQFCPPGIRKNIYQELNATNSMLHSPHCTPTGTEDCLLPPTRLEVNPNIQPTTHCYNSRDAGQSYQGNVAVTHDGTPCQAWSSNLVPHHIRASHFVELANAENYCRNPGQLSNSPWCYTVNSSVGWDYCLIPLCDESNATISTTSPTSLEGTIIGTCIGFSFFIVTLVALGVGVMVYCNRRIAKRIPPRDQPITLDRLQLHHGGSGSGSTCTTSGSSELKVSYTYNPQYMMHSTIPPNLIPIVNTFKQIDKSKIAYLKQLGQGNFGVVFQGKLMDGEEETMVAVKTLKEETALEAFVHEAKLTFSYDHPNIIKIYGVCILDLPYYMVVEYMDKGDLAQFLRESGSSFHQRLLNPFGTRSRTESTLSNSPASLSTSQLVDICKQISGGMEYLAEKKHVHRDLACRNCLVKSGSEGLIVKICDFGMSHNLYTQDYYRVKGQAVLPVRWMSPEAVVYGKFSTAGDVWSFGVVMWEVFSFAMQPYFGVSNEQVTDFIRRGRTLSRPADCPHKIYEIMKDCWNMTPSARPSFSELHGMLNECHESISSGDDRSSSSPDQISQLDSELDSDAFYEENSSIDGGDD